MNSSQRFELSVETKSLIAYLFVPLFIVLPAAFYLSLAGIHDVLKHTGKNYVDRIEDVVTEIEIDTTLAMNYLNSCEAIGEKLLFANNLRELIIVRDSVAVCSSKRGDLNVNIENILGGQKIMSGLHLYDIDQDEEQRTIVVASALPGDGSNGVFGVVDPTYLIGRLLDIEDTNVDKVTAQLNGKTYPADREFHSSTIHDIIKSKHFDFSLLVEADSDFITRRFIFGFMTALPISLLISVLLYLVMNRLKKRDDLAQDLKQGLKREELFLVYQPLVGSEEYDLRGFEALIRWQHPSMGLVRPDIFISLAEREHLINDITDFVLKRAYQDLNNGRTDYNLSLGVNVPPSYLHEEKNLLALIHYGQLFSQIGIVLTTEITERQMLDDKGREALHRLREHGMRISIDDFGTGHTALSVIQQTEFDYLKIDKCFVDTIGVETVNSAVLNTIIELGHRLNVQMVAEGVEEEHQAQYLAKMGVHKLQGYYFAKPLSLKEIETTWL